MSPHFSHSSLEWEYVLAELAVYATSIIGQNKCKSLQPTDIPEQVAIQQTQTQEMKNLLEKEGGLPLGGIRNLYPLYQEIEKGRLLTPTDLLDILETIRATHVLRNYGLNKKHKIPILFQLFEWLTASESIEHAIKTCIHPDGNIADTASQSLTQIRHKIRQLQEKLRADLSALLSKYRHLSHDPAVLQREGRYVIPLKAGSQGQVKGVVHDQSATGATIYLEPLSVLPLNNSLRKEFSKERDEENRILFELTKKIASQLEPLRLNLDILAQLDCIYAKAHYALKLKARRPQMNIEQLQLTEIRHPLLIKELGWEPVVPISIHFPPGLHTLIVTGPNTGGKTVSLKTLGLAVMMHQSGLQLPATRAELPVFQKVLGVIGDAQSLQHNLSTFSAHIRQIQDIVQQVNQRSLVLIDEIATGTDPMEGSALARSIIRHLTDVGCQLLVTTHYNSLTDMAAEDSRIQNANVSFDLETLQPTYHFHQGNPGQSHGLNIAQRLGISDSILEQARNWLGEKHANRELMLEQLEARNRALLEEFKRLQARQLELDALEERYKKQFQQMEHMQQQIKQDAQENIDQDLEAAREKIRHLTRELQRNPNLKMVQKTREQIDMVTQKLSPPPKKKPTINNSRIQHGDWVFIVSMNQYGELVELPDRKGQVTVICNHLRLKVHISKIRISSRRKEKKKDTQGILVQTYTRAQRECDLHQMRTHEAIPRLEKFLDAAYQSNLEQVYIIHGKGEGKLKQAVHEYLKDCPYIKSYRMGQYGEGEDGVTIAELK